MLISLSFTSLSVLGFLGCLFMMSLSACSYAREIAGTFGDGIRLLLEPLLFATVHSHPCLTFSAWERVLPQNPRHSIQVRTSPLFHPPRSALTDKERMLRCGEPVSIQLSHTYNPSTKENCIWTFSSYYFFLKGTRNPHFFFEKKKKGIHHVSAQVNAEDGDCSQWERYVCNDEDQERRDFRNVTGQGVSNRLLQVIKDQAPWGREKTSITLA